MANIGAYAAFLITGLVIISVFSIVADIFQEEKPAGNKTMTRSIQLAFSISKLLESKDVRLPDAVLVNGILFGSTSLLYNLSVPNDTKEISLKFDVIRTNRYAPLKITADSFVEARKFPKGSYALDVGKKEGSMLISIEPESSWWRIWAPALYELNNTKLTINAFKSESSDFSFSLDKEFPTLHSAGLVLQFDKAVGSFVAEVNGNKIYSNGGKGVQTIPINISLLARENMLVLKAMNNSEFAGRWTLVINYKV